MTIGQELPIRILWRLSGLFSTEGAKKLDNGTFVSCGVFRDSSQRIDAAGPHGNTVISELLDGCPIPVGNLALAGYLDLSPCKDGCGHKQTSRYPCKEGVSDRVLCV
jgi:hypothetical protein